MCRIAAIALVAGCAAPPAPPPRSAPERPAAGPRALPAATGECDGDWCWENPLPRDRGATAIWGAARDDVWAVGNAGLIEHYDGARWTTVPGIAKHNLFAVGGAARDDVWAVGYVGIAMHWDGTHWTRHDLGGAQGYCPNAVGVDDRGRSWVVSEVGVLGWDGTRWTTDASLESRADLCAAPVARSASGGAIVALPRGQWWDGETVVAARPGPDRRLGGTRPSRLWLWGLGVERWELGRTVPLAAPFYAYAIWGASDDDVWAAGPAGALARWDGARWRTTGSGVRGELHAAWGSAADDVWIGGDAALIHWDGRALTSATRSQTDADLLALWGASACDVWAAGEHGTALHRACAPWAAVPTGVGGALRGIGGSSPGDVWLVGDGGAILHWDGHALAAVASPTDRALHAVWARSARDAWAVGASGTIVHWDGARWSAVASPSQATLLRITGDDRRAIAVGEAAAYLTWDGARWTAFDRAVCTSDSRADAITGIALDGGDIITSCHSSAVRVGHPDGTWYDAIGTEGFSMSYDDLAERDGAIAIAAWYGTVAYRRDGTWRQLDAPTAWPLDAVWIAPDGAVWVAGAHGMILVYRPRLTARSISR
ncbi:MAG TPA: hypothetical protein VLX92_29110 [Kofleriaceae bacterium]|nr:hypothetical protein [Kofleriaceae bacterium]